MTPEKGFNSFRNFIGSPTDSGDRLPSNPTFASFAWFCLFFNVLVVAFGVFLRAAGFGDGCGTNWPLCTGDKNPAKGPMATLIESTHRISTELVGLLAIIMLVWAVRSFTKGHPVKKFAVGFLIFTGIEALIGRHLVIHKLVTDKDTVERAIWMCAHVISLLSG